MADPYLNPALTGFRNAVNRAYPNRDKGSDGWIGDPAHQARTSDHNPDPDGSVDAWDMDVEVNGKGRPASTDVEALKRVFEQHPSSNYWIHNDQIAKRSEGWVRRSYAYAGPERNRHTQHVHYNTRAAYENSTAPWIIPTKETPDMTPEEHNWLRDNNFMLGNAIDNPTGEGGSVPFHVWAEWMTKTVKALAVSIAELKALIESFEAGDMTADQVVDALSARLSN